MSTKCAICFGSLSEPTSTPCGHSFCRPCLAAWLRDLRARSPRPRATCPVCRAPIESNPRRLRVNLALAELLAAAPASSSPEHGERDSNEDRSAARHAQRGESKDSADALHEALLDPETIGDLDDSAGNDDIAVVDSAPPSADDCDCDCDEAVNRLTCGAFNDSDGCACEVLKAVLALALTGAGLAYWALWFMVLVPSDYFTTLPVSSSLVRRPAVHVAGSMFVAPPDDLIGALGAVMIVLDLTYAALFLERECMVDFFGLRLVVVYLMVQLFVIAELFVAPAFAAAWLSALAAQGESCVAAALLCALVWARLAGLVVLVIRIGASTEAALRAADDARTHVLEREEREEADESEESEEGYEGEAANEAEETES